MTRLWPICGIDDPTTGSLLLPPDAAPIGDYPSVFLEGRTSSW
ncbi:hypothetical protein [Rhizobium lentis]|nr:hypothetical protein [Rhizobium lentis]